MRNLFYLIICMVFSNWSMISEERLVFLRDHVIEDRRSCLEKLTPADVLEVAVFTSIIDLDRAQKIFYLCLYDEKDYGEVLKRIGASSLGEDSALKMAQWLMPYIVMGNCRISPSDFNEVILQGCKQVYYQLVKYFLDTMGEAPDHLSLGLDIQEIQNVILRWSKEFKRAGDFKKACSWLILMDKLAL